MNACVPFVGDWPWTASDSNEPIYPYEPTSAGTSAESPGLGAGWIASAMVFALTTTTSVAPAATLEALVGTGGSLENLSREDRTDALSSKALATLFFEQVGKRAQASAMAAPDAPELIADIKSTLGVSITDLAAIVGVSRRAIYDWIGGGHVSDANKERLMELKQVSAGWQQRSNRPLGRLLRQKLGANDTLLDLLKANRLDQAQVAHHLDSLASMSEKQDQQRLARKAKFAPLNDQGRYENTLANTLPATHS